MSNRRSFLATAALGTLAAAAAPSLHSIGFEPIAAGAKHELPALPYEIGALEPHIDAQTMQIHHDKHHLAYVNGLNKAEEELAKARASGDFRSYSTGLVRLRFMVADTGYTLCFGR